MITNFDSPIIKHYSPISSKGGRRRKSRTRTRRHKRSNKSRTRHNH